MGVLYARVAGAWVPVAAQGPPGTPASSTRLPARAFTCTLAHSGTLTTSKQGLAINNVILNDGFTVTTSYVKVLAAGRFMFTMTVTIVGGLVGNWIIYGFDRKRWADSALLSTHEVVGNNALSGYRTYTLTTAMDLNADDYFYPFVTPDLAGASVDTRSLFSVTEIAW
jgi:hypothetical protein